MRRRQLAARMSAAQPREQMDALLKAFRAAHPMEDIELIECAYTVAAYAHRGQTRKSGDPFISHPIAVAMIVTELGMAPDIVCAALLHDTVDYDATHAFTLAQLREEFGEKIAALVEGVSELDRIGHGHAEEKLRHVEAALKLNTDSVSMLQSPEVVVLVLKLADRLHNMRTMRYLPSGRQQLKSRETLRVHAPLAGLLGMKPIQRELEDLASSIIYPCFDQRPQTVPERALAAVAVLLPSAARARWLQEWAGELSVLPTRRARARFALQMLRGIPRLAVVLRQRTPYRDAPRPMNTIVDQIVGFLAIGAAFVAAATRWEPLAWTAGAMALGGLILLSAVLFARSDDPARRLRKLIRTSLARPCFYHSLHSATTQQTGSDLNWN